MSHCQSPRHPLQTSITFHTVSVSSHVAIHEMPCSSKIFTIVESHLYVECHNECEPANLGQGEVIIGSNEEAGVFLKFDTERTKNKKCSNIPTLLMEHWLTSTTLS